MTSGRVKYMMAAPPILSCKSARKTMYILLTISFIITPSLGQSFNVAFNKTVDQSSTLDYPSASPWSASYAVDGRIPVDQNVDNCHCCSSTNKDSNNSLTLDLGDVYTIYSIYVLARPTGDNGGLNLAKMYISNTTSMAASPTYTHLQEIRHFTWNATEGTFARYVKLTRPRDEYLIVCEIKVFKRDCTSRRYGPACAQECLNCASCSQTGGNCSRCIDGKYGDTCQQSCSVSCAEPFCYRNNGHCTTCIAGKYGNTCQDNCSVNCAGSTCKKDSGHCNTCVGGKYGETCSTSCPPQCEGNICDRMNGHCMTGCKPGYLGDNCDSPCHDGRYGNDCMATCGHCSEAAKCNKTDGICMTGCMPGYKPGNCAEECDHGHFGHHCNGTCGQCLNMTECNTQNGVCMTGCMPGFKSPCCKDDCDGGHYGLKCTQICGNCADMTSCNNRNGTCMTGCIDGYQPGLCKQPCSQGTYGHHCTDKCGQCLSMTMCNTTNGTCMTGCLEGFKPGLCKEECNAGQYGFNCAKSCGSCSDNRYCNKVTGACMTGCTAGYQPGLCNQTCTMQTFGVNCKERCHCADRVQCNVVTGVCPGGKCDIGFGLQNCTHDFNILPRINDTFTTSQSTTSSNWGSTRAVDGKLGPDADSCQCCSSTNDNPTDKWWFIDLHQQYLVQYVQIYSRTSNRKPQQIQGIQVVIANSTDDRGQIIFNDTSENGKDVYTIDVIPVRPLQIVKILRSSPEPLVICEVKILETFCKLGHYGFNCSRSCNCGDKHICHPVTGHCKSSSCVSGWKGPACEEACQPGSYGANCQLTCRCTNVTSCSRYDGSCGGSSCSPGYQETDCQTECDKGFYGQNCSFKCGNCAANPCSFIDGNCTDGCAEGVAGFLCKQSLSHDASSSSVVAAAVGSVAAVGVIGLVIAVVYVRRKRCKCGRTSKAGKVPQSTNNAAFDENASTDTLSLPDHLYDDIEPPIEPESPYPAGISWRRQWLCTICRRKRRDRGRDTKS